MFRMRGARLMLILALLTGSAFSEAATPANIQTLAAFSYSSEKAAQKAWVPKEASPTVQFAKHRARGLTFPCPFSKNTDRFVWDHNIKLNLTDYQSLEFDFSCDQPSAIRALSIYLKSGKGWYVWTGKISGPGRQILSMMKADFKPQGKPSGWHAIERIRLSPWKGASLDTAISGYSLQARNNAIVLIQGTASAKDASEKAIAKRCTMRLSNWLQKAGVPHDIMTDEQVMSQKTTHVKLFILCYNPSLPKKEVDVLESHLKNGGKIIVFYSASERLAKLMHVRLGLYQVASRYGQWTSFLFTDPEKWHVPEMVFQESWNIWPVYPADKTASVIATWQNIKGELTGDPAWVTSKQGLWMSHILLDDDAEAKQQMLLGLIAHYLPSVWPRAAWLCLQRAGRIDSCSNLSETISVISTEAEKTTISPQVTSMLLKKARILFTQMLDDYELKSYASVVDKFHELRNTLVNAYARVQTPMRNEFRGVWDHQGTGIYPGDWDETCRVLAKNGITAIFPNIAWGGIAHYKSRILKQSDTVKRYGDQLAACVRAAHKYGLEVHAWIVCWNLQGSSPDEIKRLKDEGRLLTKKDGTIFPWLNPAHPTNRKQTLAMCKEIASRYSVDGIQLDYIRYPDQQTGFGPATRKLFEKTIRHKIKNWPEDVQQGGNDFTAFSKWRESLITSFVSDVNRTVKTEKPALKLSAAVYGRYPECKTTKAQDWGYWLKKDLVDFVSPMDYTMNAGEYRRLLENQSRLPNAQQRIFPGIGVTATESQLTADQVIEQILIGREFGYSGFMLFDLDPTLRDKILPLLSLGVTRK